MRSLLPVIIEEVRQAYSFEADVVNAEGESVSSNEGGYLVIKKPWPGMMRTVYGDEKRFRESYWEYLKPSDNSYIYFAGDGARRDEEGYFWVMGRVDDVINVSGHRLGTMEIESALVSHELISEAAVVGRPDDLKGESIVAFVTLKTGAKANKKIVGIMSWPGLYIPFFKAIVLIKFIFFGFFCKSNSQIPSSFSTKLKS